MRFLRDNSLTIVLLGAFALGLAGMLLAVPILMVAKAVCDHVPGLDGLSVFISDNNPA